MISPVVSGRHYFFLASYSLLTFMIFLLPLLSTAKATSCSTQTDGKIMLLKITLAYLNEHKEFQ